MKKTLKMALLLAASFFGQMTVPGLPSIGVAFAKPPDWAPAHGYRRKHHDHDYENDDQDRRKVEVREIVVSRYEEIFRRLDSNRDGRISRSEWEEGDSLFDRLDKNHDGVLSRNEYEGVDEERGFLSGLLYKVKDKLASLWDKLW
ncbi:MAG TPA: hypothetical protein VFX30_14460 [bacterium]|nr:hypothetical protein [bacterium]